MADLVVVPMIDESILKFWDPFRTPNLFGDRDPFEGTNHAKSNKTEVDSSKISDYMPNNCLEAVGHTFFKAKDPMQGIDLSLRKQETIKLKDKPYDKFSRIEIYNLRVPFEADRKLLKKIIVSHHRHREYNEYPDVVFDRSSMHTNDKDEDVLLRGPICPPNATATASIWVYTEDESFGVDISKRFHPTDVIMFKNYEYWEDRKRYFLINVIFEVIPKSVEAHIDITLPVGFEFGGEISATTDGHQLSKRILASSTKFDNPLRLNRSVLAMRLNEVLHLHFDMNVNGEKYKGEARILVPKNASEISGECTIVSESEWNLLKKRGVKRTNEGQKRKYRLGLSDCKSKIPLRIKVRFESDSLDD